MHHPPKPFSDSFEGSSILIAEDNAFALDIMSTYLKRQGMSTETAENGQAALDKYLANPTQYHMIFMDLQMPVMGGYEATEKIRESGCPGAKSVPIVAMSGDPLSSPEDFGFSGQLRKPFGMESILSILSELLS